MARSIELTIQHGDIMQIDADVVALKFAQSFYGADRAVAIALSGAEIPAASFSLDPAITCSPLHGESSRRRGPSSSEWGH
jgi:hypothetical protein